MLVQIQTSLLSLSVQSVRRNFSYYISIYNLKPQIKFNNLNKSLV